MRIYIRDKGGAELTKIMEFPFNEDKDIVQAATIKPFGTFNLSEIPIHYYSERPPSVTEKTIIRTTAKQNPQNRLLG